jgi:16S rRNA (guanine966-N2)-methyltransferase
MRVVAGSLGGLHLKAPKGHRVRPTADQVREAVFNILVSRFFVAGVDVLDLFAGTGALGIEALSRGARAAVFVDTSPEAQRVIRENLHRARLRRHSRILRAYAAKGIKVMTQEGRRFGGVFLDPPYGEGWVDKTLRLLGPSTILQSGAWVVVEHSQEEVGAESYAALVLTEQRRYGTTGVSFYQRQGEEVE